MVKLWFLTRVKNKWRAFRRRTYLTLTLLRTSQPLMRSWAKISLSKVSGKVLLATHQKWPMSFHQGWSRKLASTAVLSLKLMHITSRFHHLRSRKGMIQLLIPTTGLLDLFTRGICLKWFRRMSTTSSKTTMLRRVRDPQLMEAQSTLDPLVIMLR